MKTVFILILQKTLNFRLSAFLILCFALGGTSQDIVAPKLPLYLLSLFFIGLALIKIDKDSHVWRLKTPLLFLLLFVIVHFIYLLPLPPSIWTELAGRERIVEGFNLIGSNLPWLPLSLAPEKTLFSLLDFLPPLAMIMMIGGVASDREMRVLFWAIPIFATFTVLLAIAQVSGVSQQLYFYDFTNASYGVGFFSNTNHQASFLLMALPFAISLYKTISRQTNNGDDRAALSLSVVTSIFIVLGILLTGSIAGYLLLIPILLISLYLCVSKMRIKKAYLLGVAIILVGGIVIDFIFFGNYLREFLANFNQTGQGSRQVMFATTNEAAMEFFPLGSGPGSFADVYKMYGMVGKSSIPHAHNDFLELFLELGLVGIALGGGFLVWWGKQIITIMRKASGSSLLAKCASLSMMSVIIHSAADYPLRTISLSTFFMLCLCIAVLKLDMNGKPSS